MPNGVKHPSTQAVLLVLVLDAAVAGWFAAQHLSRSEGTWVPRAVSLGPAPYVPQSREVRLMRVGAVLAIGMGLVFAIRWRRTRNRIRQVTPAIVLGCAM